MGGISIKQIAQMTGLSVATVSRIINHKGYYSAQAEERVRRVVEEYHYVPNMIARSLKTSRTDTIGIIIPDVRGDFFSNAIVRMQQAFFSHGYSTVIFNTNHDLSLARACMDMMHSNQVSGIINFTGSVIHSDASVPVLYFDRKPDDPACTAPYIVGNNHHGGQLAAQHLIKKDCARFCVITPSHLSSNHTERLNGFVETLEKNGVPHENIVHKPAQGYSVQDGCDCALDMLQNDRCDCVFAVNDYLTTGVLQAVNQMQLSVPDDLRIVGYDVNSILRLINPTFTTVTQPMEEMTNLAVSRMLEMLRGGSAPTSVTLPVSLRIGQTT